MEKYYEPLKLALMFTLTFVFVLWFDFKIKPKKKRKRIIKEYPTYFLNKSNEK